MSGNFYQFYKCIHVKIITIFRVIRDVTRQLCGDYKWTVGALKAIHEGSEAFLITILEYANLAAIHGGCVTIKPKDIQLVMKIKEVTAAYKSDEPLTGPIARERRAEKDDDRNKRKDILLELRFKRGKMIAVQSGSSGDLQNGQPQPGTSAEPQPGTSAEPQPGTSRVCGRSDNDNSESDSHTVLNNIISDDDSEDELPQNGKKRKRIISESTDEENHKKKQKKEQKKDEKRKKDEQKKDEEKRKKDEQKKDEKRKKDEQKKDEKRKKDEKKKDDEERKKDEQKKDEEKRKKDEQKKDEEKR